jgi:hypothetical protein
MSSSLVSSSFTLRPSSAFNEYDKENQSFAPILHRNDLGSAVRNASSSSVLSVVELVPGTQLQDRERRRGSGGIRLEFVGCRSSGAATTTTTTTAVATTDYKTLYFQSDLARH